MQAAVKAANAQVSLLEKAAQTASNEGTAGSQEVQRLQSALNQAKQQCSDLVAQVGFSSQSSYWLPAVAQNVPSQAAIASFSSCAARSHDHVACKGEWLHAFKPCSSGTLGFESHSGEH